MSKVKSIGDVWKLLTTKEKELVVHHIWPKCAVKTADSKMRSRRRNPEKMSVLEQMKFVEGVNEHTHIDITIEEIQEEIVAILNAMNNATKAS